MCSQARPSTRGVACPVQWLPLLLTSALPSSPPPPSAPPGGTTDLTDGTWSTLIVLLAAAVLLLMLGCRHILRHRADRRAYRADQEQRRARRRAERRADRRAKRHGLKKGPSRAVLQVVQRRADVSKPPAQQPASLTDARATLPPGRPVRRAHTAPSARSSASRSRSYSTGSELKEDSGEGRPTPPPGPPSSSGSNRTSWPGGLSHRTGTGSARTDSSRGPGSGRTDSDRARLSNRTTSGRSSSRSQSPSPPHAAPASVLPGALTAASPCADGCCRRPLSSTSTAPSAAPTVDPSPSLVRRGNVSARPNKRPAVESASSLGAKRVFTSPYVEFCRAQRPLLPAEMNNRDREKLLGVHSHALPLPRNRPRTPYGNPMILVVAVWPWPVCILPRLHRPFPCAPHNHTR